MTDAEETAALETIRRTLQHWYYRTVEQYAVQIQKEARDEERDLDDVLHETLDGASEVIYTGKAQLVIAASNNDDAYLERVKGGDK